MSTHIDVMRYFLPLQESNVNIWFSYGENIPKLEEPFIFWGAGGFAASMKNSELVQTLTSPGAQWLANLPKKMILRDIEEVKFIDLVNSDLNVNKIWVKPSEAKISNFKPGVKAMDEIREVLKAHPEYKDFSLQWTDTILALNYEHRFFIADQKILTGSPYLIDGRVFHEDISWNFYEDAYKFAETVVNELENNQPRGYVLDVGFDTQKEKWCVIEGNRSWSSGLYGVDVNKALTSIQISQESSPENIKWNWLPDSLLQANAPLVKEIDYSPEVSGLFRF